MMIFIHVSSTMFWPIFKKRVVGADFPGATGVWFVPSAWMRSDDEVEHEIENMLAHAAGV